MTHSRLFPLIAIAFIVSAHASTTKPLSQRQQADGDQSSPAYIKKLLTKAHTIYHSSQVILVTARSADDFHASLAAYTFRKGQWRKVMPKIPAVIGKRGFTLNEHEGSLESPVGIYYIGRSFGSADKPAGVKLAYTKTSHDDYWIDDPTSADYNQWVSYAGNPNKKWKSYEKLKIPAYKYAAVIRYNMNPIVKGRGSAIFLHIWSGPNRPTAGCTAVSENHVLHLLKWMAPRKHPVIIQGTVTELKHLAK